MNKSRIIVSLAVVTVASLWAFRELQIHANYFGGGIGPDVIVGDMPNISRWGSSGDRTGFSIGTTSCNIGDEQLRWISNSTAHPVISQNLFRVKDGRIEQLGQSWLKHGFFALSQSLCGTCQPTSGSALGIGCSDPYSSGLNGSHSGLGPRSEVNAATGAFLWPHRALSGSQRGTLDGRISVANSDLDPAENPNALYFIESQYIHPDDAAAGNDNNNASYRQVSAIGSNGVFDLQIVDAPTVREKPAINAWQAVHPDVRLFNVDIPDDGRIIVGVRTIPVGDGFHNEIAIENLTSHQSVRSLNVSCSSGEITNPGFNDVDYQHEPYSSDDWAPSVNESQIEWATETFDVNENANALRWSTLYSFWCDSTGCPTELTLGLFRPGTISEVTIDICTKVTPDQITVTRGTYVSGGIPELALSDDADLTIQRQSSDLQSRTEVEVKGLSPTATPSLLEVTLEGSVFARGQVIQTIELFDYSAGSWEQIDSRDADQFNDASITVAATGDLSRFVEADTNSVEARIRFQSPVNRQKFASNTDQFIWTIGN